MTISGKYTSRNVAVTVKTSLHQETDMDIATEEIAKYLMDTEVRGSEFCLFIAGATTR